MTNENQTPTVEGTEVTNPETEDETSFDLPIDETAPKAKPRVFMAPGESACVSCEG